MPKQRLQCHRRGLVMPLAAMKRGRRLVLEIVIPVNVGGDGQNLK